MRSKAVRCVVLGGVAATLALSTWSTWMPYLFSSEPPSFTTFDQIQFFVEDGAFDTVDLEVQILSETAQRADPQMNLPPDTGAVVSFTARKKDARGNTPDVYVLFKNAAGDAATYCGSSAPAPTPYQPDTAPFLVNSEASGSETRAVHAVEPHLIGPSVTPRDAAVDYSCRFPDSVVWSHNRQKSYFAMPMISVETWDDHTSAVWTHPSDDYTDAVTAKTCTTATYAPQPYERLDAAGLRPSTERLGARGEQVWNSCKAWRSWAFAGTDRGQWSANTQVGVNAFVAIGENAEAENERRLFLAGIFVGLVSALLIEAFNLALELTVAHFRPQPE